MKVFIIGGGGTLGSAAAFQLARSGLADEIVLYDLESRMALHHAMDIAQAVCLLTKTKVRAGAWVDMEGSDVVILAAGVPFDRQTGDHVKDAVILLPLVRELAAALPRLAPQAVTIVMSNPVDAISYHLCRLSGLRKGQFAGFSYNDVIRARWGIGRHLGVSPEAVSCAVVGEHGASKVPLFSSAQVNGGPANLSRAQIEIIEEENRNWWESFLALEVKRTAGWTSAAGVTVMLEHLAGIRQAPICCSCVLEGELGYDGLSMGVEARLGSGGVAEILPLRASAEEKAAIDASARKIQSAIAALGSLLDAAK